MRVLSHKPLTVHAIYLMLLALSGLGAVVFASFDAPYGPAVYAEEAVYSVLGGLMLYPIPAILAYGLRQGLKRGLIVAVAAALLLTALHPLHVRLYKGYTTAEALTLTRYLANAPIIFLLTAAGGIVFILTLPLWLLGLLLG